MITSRWRTGPGVLRSGFSGKRLKPYHWLALATGLLVLVVLATIAATHFRAREHLRAELQQVQGMMARGRLSAASKSLADLDRRWPRRGEVLLLLGQCERALGQPERALAAWGQVASSDPIFVQVAESHAHLMIDLGRFAPAESFLLNALAETPQSQRQPLLRTLARLFRLEGRYPEVSEALIAAWSGASDPSRLLQELWQNDTEPVPVDAWKVVLDAGDNQDDRVWLGRARQALVAGRFNDAEAQLQECLKRRPDDPVVWKAFLDLAMATENAPRLWEAMERIPDTFLQPREIASLRCRLASRIVDRTYQRRECARMVELEPSSSMALERLAALAMEAGDPKEARRLHARKAEVDHAKDQIRRLVILKADFRSQARELARLSAVLGRAFDEHAWSLVAATNSDKVQAAISAGESPSPGSDPSLDRSRAFCHAASRKALERLLMTSRESQPGDRHMLADRLADLRGAQLTRSDESTVDRGPAKKPGPRLHFADIAESVGLHFVFDNGRSPMWLLPESLSGGVGLIDFDGDGWLDVYCVQGASEAPGSMIAETPERALQDLKEGDRLFRNMRDGSFRDATHQAGIDRLSRGLGYGMGVATGDYDNDGDTDLFLTRLDRYVLLRNRGDGTFEDVTERVGLSGPRENPTSAAFADLDNDGDLDLYVCHYARWDPANPPRCRNEKGEYYYCDPAKYESAVDHVFRNDGGQFVDVTEAAGFTDHDGRGLGVVAADFDGDHRIDLFVANDGTANFLFRNKGGFQFEEIALTAGVSGGSDGGFLAGMGVAAADLDGDGRLDLLVTNLYGEGTTLYHNLGQGVFTDRSTTSGILQATRYLTGFGIAAFDPANDGRLHVAITNGHVNDFRPFYPFAMPSRLYESRSDGHLVDVSDQAGPAWVAPRLGRGMAAGDLDNDGRTDLVIMVQNEPLAYFHNQTERAGRFVTLRLEGTKSNRDGVGARVVVSAGARKQVAERVGGGSYLAAPDGRLHFGLGEATAVESVEVRWPSGHVDRWANLASNTGYTLREGEAPAQPQFGFSDRSLMDERISKDRAGH